MNDELDAGIYVRKVSIIDSIIEGRSRDGLSMTGGAAGLSLVNHIQS